MNITEGENLVLNCVTEGVPADITYSRWIHTGEFISHRVLEGEEATNDYILRINEVSYRDTGRYTCQADNGHYAKERMSNVVVFCKYVDMCLTLDQTNFDILNNMQLLQIPQSACVTVKIIQPSFLPSITLCTYQ